MKKFFVLMFILVASSAWAANPFPPAVYKAHEAYLQGQKKELMVQIKEALVESKNHPAVVKNMMDLYSAAFKNGMLNDFEPEWRLPSEVDYAGIDIHRRYRVDTGNVGFFLAISFGLKDGAELEQFQVIRYPDQVLLDKQARVGDWYIEPSPADLNVTDIWSGAERTASPVADGLYLLNIKLKNQAMVQGWFVLANKNSSASPVLATPVKNQVFTTGQPTFHWRTFQSPEYQPGETKRLDVKVQKNNDNGDDVMEADLSDLASTSYRVGTKTGTKEYIGHAELAPDSYFCTITYREIEHFGSMLKLRRASSSRVPFTVR